MKQEISVSHGLMASVVRLKGRKPHQLIGCSPSHTVSRGF